MSSKRTFWELIEGNKIEVPVIQRDYAQGRKEDKVNTIRKEFVSDLVKTLKGEKDHLHLGFVYGKIEGKDKHVERERNKRAIENILNAVEGYAQQLDMKIDTDISSLTDAKSDGVNLPTFIPLDGQQRLTTLFLLHWYLIVFSELEDQEIKFKILQRFRYKTRKSSTEFCEVISQAKNVEQLRENDVKLSEKIKNQKWFRKIWLKDSTVKGMLVMLDEINTQLYESQNKKELLKHLLNKDNTTVSFDFLDLNELNQTDELYVKMNARGKQLSEFEHFKAWLQNYVSSEKVISNDETDSELFLGELIEEKDWKLKLDRSWLDLFWKNKEVGVFQVDSVIYHAVQQLTLYAYIASNGKSVDEEVTKVIRVNSYIPFSYYEQHNVFNAETLNFLFNSLNAISDRDRISKYDDWLSEINTEPFIGSNLRLTSYYLKNDKSVDRPEAVFYYALLLFLNYSNNIDSKDNFKNWMRFSRNIIFNTYIQNPENYIDAISALYGLKENIDSIIEYIQDPETNISFFSVTVKNEINKTRLIESGGNQWKELILRFENHPYFKGDIEFLLQMSRVDGEIDFESFKEYGECLSVLFMDDIRDHKEKILQRALLTCGNYLPQVGANLLLPMPNRESLRARRDNWQRVFNDSVNQAVLKSLCDKIKGDLSNLKSKLMELIDDYESTDWMWYFVKSPKVLNFCAQGFIRFNDVNDILLLKTSRGYGRHAELRSYFCFYHYGLNVLENTRPFNKKHYWENRMGQYEFPCIQFSDWNYNKNSYRLEVTFFKEGKYMMQVLNDNSVEIDQAIINVLIGDGWCPNSEGTKVFKHFNNTNEVLGKIRTTFNNLSSIS